MFWEWKEEGESRARREVRGTEEEWKEGDLLVRKEGGMVDLSLWDGTGKEGRRKRSVSSRSSSVQKRKANQERMQGGKGCREGCWGENETSRG